jgi:hypothetical protein
LFALDARKPGVTILVLQRRGGFLSANQESE